MSENTTESSTPETEGVESPETGTAKKPLSEMTPEEKVDFLTSQNRKLEDRLKGKSDDPQKSVPYLTKQRDALQKELDGIKQSQMSEQEKIIARAEAAERALAETTAARLRSEVALDLGLTTSQAKRLVGTTREELEADADELLADLKKTAPGFAPSSDGQGKQGDVVGQTKQITSRDELKSMSREEKLAAYRDGRLKSLTG